MTYNYINLPATSVHTTNIAVNLSYTYDATGNKLVKNSSGTVRKYINGIEYKPDGTTIDIIHTGDGIARNSNGTYSYEYNLGDHLGNVRATFYKNPSTNLLEVLQRDNYYAFGLRKVASGGTNKYLYNGKELQEELGQYDYGARFYDPVIGRWNCVDPMSGIYPSESPYVFAGNSPVNFIDGGGLFKISAKFARMYPTLTKMLKYYLPMLKDNPVVRNAFIETTGMGGKFFDQMVSYGSGPWIVPSRYDLQNSINFTDPAYQSGSQYRPDYNEENLYIEGENLAALERAFKSASTGQKGNELGFQMFFTSLTIMHEAAHYGFFKKHGAKEALRVGAFGREIGVEFEGRAYQRFSYVNKAEGAMNQDAIRKYYNLNSSSPGLIGMTLMQDLGGYSFNKFFLKEVKASGSSQGPNGQDPHVNPKPHQH